ncbi:MAG: hypothetical protein ACLTKI_08930, partial [Lachnospiraceae bacterium]
GISSVYLNLKRLTAGDLFSLQENKQLLTPSSLLIIKSSVHFNISSKNVNSRIKKPKQSK